MMKESVAEQGTHYFTAINALAERHRYRGDFDEPSVLFTFRRSCTCTDFTDVSFS